MTILAVDTSCYVASAALVRDGVCIKECFADASRRHAETVQPLVETLLTECGVSVSRVDLFAVDVGPGSFTGVRIGVAMINAMAYAAGKPVVAVDALRTLAEPFWDGTEPVAAVVDAGHGNAYAALYRAGETLLPPDAVNAADFLSTLPEDARTVGDLAALPEQTYPSAKRVGEAAYRLRSSATKEARPVYLRPSQAERMWKERQEAKQLGL